MSQAAASGQVTVRALRFDVIELSGRAPGGSSTRGASGGAHAKPGGLRPQWASSSGTRRERGRRQKRRFPAHRLKGDGTVRTRLLKIWRMFLMTATGRLNAPSVALFSNAVEQGGTDRRPAPAASNASMHWSAGKPLGYRRAWCQNHYNHWSPRGSPPQRYYAYRTAVKGLERLFDGTHCPAGTARQGVNRRGIPINRSVPLAVCTPCTW